MKKAYKICWVMAVVMSQACHNAEKTPSKRFDKDPGFITDNSKNYLFLSARFFISAIGIVSSLPTFSFPL